MSHSNALETLTDEQRKAVVNARTALELDASSRYFDESFERPLPCTWFTRAQENYEDLTNAFPDIFGPDSYFENYLLPLTEGC